MITAPVTLLKPTEIHQISVVGDNHQSTARLHNTKNCSQHRVRLGDVFNRLYAKNDIVLVTLKIQFFNTAIMYSYTRFADDCYGTAVQIYAFQRPAWIAVSLQ